MSTVIAKGSVVNNPSLNDIGRAHFVRCTATGGTQTIEIRSLDRIHIPYLFSQFLFKTRFR